MLDKFGYTEGCEGCRHKRSGVGGGNKPHSEICRSRINEAVERDEDLLYRRILEKDRMRYHADKENNAEKADNESTPDNPGVDEDKFPEEQGGKDRHLAVDQE